jgi:hypothetical protein
MKYHVFLTERDGSVDFEADKVDESDGNLVFHRDGKMVAMFRNGQWKGWTQKESARTEGPHAGH